jgi:hypothetical protein
VSLGVTVTPEERNERATPQTGDQLEWEARLGPRVGIGAAVGAIFVAGSFAAQLPLLRDRTKNEAQYLTSVHKHASAYGLSGILQLVAFLLVGAALWYLFRATKSRRPQAPPIGLVLAVVGPVAFGVIGAIGPFVIRHYAAEFVAGANHTNAHAKDLVNAGSAKTLGFVTPIAGLTFIFAMVMNNVNAIRVGLLSGFVGIVGVIAGILFLIPIGPPQLLLFFWLAAVAVILLDRWPGGRGPAWASGEAQKWPTAMERRGMAPGAGRAPRQARGAEPEDTRVVEPGEAQSSQTRTSRKRKRKQGRKH